MPVILAAVLDLSIIQEKLFKARAPDISPGNSHLEYYNFCQQYVDHLATTRATSYNRVLFSTTFLKY